MQFATISVFIAAFAAGVASQATTTMPAACQVTQWKNPANKIDCTFYENTATATSYTDCHGCELVTRYRGVGLQCRTVTTVPGVATTTVAACSRGANGRL